MRWCQSTAMLFLGGALRPVRILTHFARMGHIFYFKQLNMSPLYVSIISVFFRVSVTHGHHITRLVVIKRNENLSATKYTFVYKSTCQLADCGILLHKCCLSKKQEYFGFNNKPASDCVLHPASARSSWMNIATCLFKVCDSCPTTQQSSIDSLSFITSQTYIFWQFQHLSNPMKFVLCTMEPKTCTAEMLSLINKSYLKNARDFAEKCLWPSSVFAWSHVFLICIFNYLNLHNSMSHLKFST